MCFLDVLFGAFEQFCAIVKGKHLLYLQPHAENVLYSLLHKRKYHNETDREQVMAAPTCVFCLHFCVPVPYSFTISSWVYGCYWFYGLRESI